MALTWGKATEKGEPPAGYVDLEDPQAAERVMRRLAEENDGRVVEVR